MNNGKPLSNQHLPSLIFISLILISVGGFLAVGPALGLVFALPFFDFNMTETIQAVVDPVGKPGAKAPTLIVQGFASFIGFIVVPMIYLLRFNPSYLSRIFGKSVLTNIHIFLTALIGISFMVAISPIVEWNQQIVLPDFLSSLEEWARSKEDMFAELTIYFTSFENPGIFLLSFLVIAIVPAIGEELLFRGLIQNQTHYFFKNIHLSIWLTALLFSLFHLQFYGLIPRLLLGVLFGYLYYWSGTLWIPILAHFVNNGVALIMAYLFQLNIVAYDIQSDQEISLLPVLIFSIITFFLVYYFKKYCDSRQVIS